VDCTHTAEGIVKLLSRPGGPITPVFDPIADTHFKANLFTGMQNTRGVEILRFSTEIAVYIGNGTG